MSEADLKELLMLVEEAEEKEAKVDAVRSRLKDKRLLVESHDKAIRVVVNGIGDVLNVHLEDAQSWQGSAEVFASQLVSAINEAKRRVDSLSGEINKRVFGLGETG